ncbi:hypothetical protein LQV63_13795 [Paenibacillus profundus]|uniref:Imm33-like domain-containing protein n=1 Tax=Paenibacillus profundus TaxID=1173085 RepID=A0ABS8YGN8_9BACL|nr:hypothetical protein [Paenibacillus profundus]MCE5170384.1 hypothetical protein [Paenibacillus profundus]
MIVRSKRIGTRTFHVTCKEELAVAADSLLQIFEELEQEEGHLKDGANIQVGWTILHLSQRGEDVAVMAPAYDKNPFVDKTDDLTASLFVQLQQNYCLQRLQLEGEAACFQDKIIAAKGVMDTERVYLERTQNGGDGDSGWYIGPVDGAVKDEDLEAYYIYQLLHLRPSLLQVLALPRGYMAVYDGDEIEAVLDAEDVNVWPSSDEA